MISTTDPESMTAEERRREVAAILANGLLRRLRAADPAASSPAKTVSKGSKTGLEPSTATRLSVAPRPGG